MSVLLHPVEMNQEAITARQCNRSPAHHAVVRDSTLVTRGCLIRAAPANIVISNTVISRSTLDIEFCPCAVRDRSNVSGQ
jgi:hypothetical protein